MVDNKFEDTRGSIQKLIGIFNHSETKNQNRNYDFENNITEVVTKKSIQNFELFAYAFDLIFDKQFQKATVFAEEIKKISEKGAKEKKVGNLYSSAENITDRDETIDLAFEIYQQHQGMIGLYESFYRRSEKNFQEKNNQIFDDAFHKKGYKFTDISFDVFLSHRYFSRFYIIIVFYILTVHFNLIVYVDWIFDRNVSRKKISEETVKLLKYRMNQSKKLVFFNILNYNTTNWMAWEVGYFSCLKEESIGILDLDGYCTGNKNVEVLSSNDKIYYEASRGLYLEKNSQPIYEWVNEKYKSSNEGT